MNVLIAIQAAVLVFLGATALVTANRGAASVRRLRRRPTQAVATIAAGPVELAGKVQSSGEPVLSLYGARCVVVRMRASAVIRQGQKQTRVLGAVVEEFDVAPAELTDASGTVPLDLTRQVLVAPVFDYTLDPTRFAELRPASWAQLSAREKRNIEEVRVSEWMVEEGASIFISGTAHPGAPSAGAGYRDGRPGFVVGSEAELPLIVSTHAEAETKRALRGPSVFLAASGLLAVALAVALIAADLMTRGIAG